MKTPVNQIISSLLLFVVIATSFLYSADVQAQYGYRRHRPVVVCPPPPVYYAPPPPMYYAPPPMYYRPAPPPVVVIKPRPHRRGRRW
ncbi:MAG: hypothetical protein ACOVQA_10610 [Thermoflexibacteraceae bacterium]|jgi:hypothetical protein